MEDALKKLDKLTQEEARVTIADNLRATHVVDERVADVNDKVAKVIRGVEIMKQVERLSSPNLIGVGYGAL